MTVAQASRPTSATAPHWAVVTAHVVALLPLPSALWRLGLALGFSGGYTEAGLVELNLDAVGIAGVLGLSVLSEAAALLTLGLVRPWGEVLPRWVPVGGGRPVPVRAAVLPALAGAAVLTALWTPMLFWWELPHTDMTDRGAFLVGFLYLPQVLWAPLLVVLAVAYRRRRCPRGARCLQ
jgi:hypothetical protein